MNIVNISNIFRGPFKYAAIHIVCEGTMARWLGQRTRGRTIAFRFPDRSLQVFIKGKTHNFHKSQTVGSDSFASTSSHVYLYCCTERLNCVRPFFRPGRKPLRE